MMPPSRLQAMAQEIKALHEEFRANPPEPERDETWALHRTLEDFDNTVHYHYSPENH